MDKFTFSFRKQGNGGTVTPLDLVSLGILTQQVSDFKEKNIGTPVLIPYNDPTGKILLNNGCIEFEVVGGQSPHF